MIAIGWVVKQFDAIAVYKFASASENESIVFGAARPGYSNEQVSQWIEFMRNQGIQRVCCLLPEAQLTRYANLLDTYRQSFGEERVCWAPLEDFHSADPDILVNRILPFLALANQQQEKVIVHCSGGVGRTGQVLAAWLVAGRGLSSHAAIAAVKRTGKNPHEAVMVAPFKGRSPWKAAEDFSRLLEACNQLRGKLA